MLPIENWIALGAFFAASLAAVYAKTTVKAVDKANEIALHSEKLKTYKGILGIRSLLQGKGKHFDERDLWSKYDYVELTEFYFNETLSGRAHEYYDLCKDIVASRELLKEAIDHEDDERKTVFQEELNDRFDKCINLGNEVTEELRNELKIHQPNKGKLGFSG